MTNEPPVVVVAIEIGEPELADRLTPFWPTFRA